MTKDALDIVYLSCCEKWWDWERDGFFSRPALLARALADHDGVRRLLVVNAPSSIARGLVNGRSGKPRSGLTRVNDKVHVLDQVRILPKDRAWRTAYRLNGLLHEPTLVKAIRSTIAELDLQRPVFWMTAPLVERTASAFGDGTLVYDAMDEWLALPEMQPLRREVTTAYLNILQRADVVFGVSERLVERFSGGNPRAYLVPNAVDGERFATTARLPDDLRDIPAPRAGYMGMLQDRIDVDLVASVARALPSVSFVFVGPVLDEAHFTPLRDLPNVHLLGARPSAVAPDYLAAFDACLLPHRDTELTRNMDPLKLYEYVAAGKPVVASDVAFVQPPELVRRSKTAEDFERNLRDALSGAWIPDQGVRDRHLSRSTWPHRLDEMLMRIREAQASKAREHSTSDGSPAVVA